MWGLGPGEAAVTTVRGRPEQSSDRSEARPGPDRVGWTACAVALSLPWAPTPDLRLDFRLDGLGAFTRILVLVS
jgi:hypothetical protein